MSNDQSYARKEIQKVDELIHRVEAMEDYNSFTLETFYRLYAKDSREMVQYLTNYKAILTYLDSTPEYIGKHEKKEV